ncbi:uncharacterized protein LOC124368537 [Homalodisca vitripennis]|uniref:uncharacterized protein LOC124368537 n=1 Tax=Homalodisca vitripennis TaxID=197043 RepID=UPI001EEA9AA2|nr:uncharacterized protein LOC124368537 [Homalodisca vitripennis]KAG8322086.1 hypothetical protein J6590_029784 [Homalodisca vitripennis]
MSYLTFILFLSSSVFLSLCSGQNQPKIDIQNEMVTCVITIINDYAIRRTVVFYTEEENSSVLWVSLLTVMKKPFMVVSQALQLHDTDKFLIVLFPRPGTRYNHLLQKLRKDTLFIIVGTRGLERFQMINLLSQFHNMRMIYDILLLPSEDRINIFTSFPYSDNHCGEAGPPTKIDSYVHGKFSKRVNLFHTKKYWNMHGCTLTCLGNRQPPDAILAKSKNGEIVFQRLAKELMNILSEKLNFSPKIVLPLNNNSSLERSWFFYNDTIDHIIEYLGNEQVDFAMGVFSRLAFTNDSAITFGKETRFECYTWAVPIRAGKKRSVIMNYLDEFSLSFWMLFLISFNVAVFIIISITTILDQNIALQSPLNAFQYTFATILNQPFPVKPKPWSLRIFIAHWLVYILVITTAYQASLWSFMTIPWQVHNIHSLQDLLDSSLEIGGAQQMHNILKAIQSNNENVKEMIKKFTVLPTSEFNDIIQRIESKRDFAVFGEKRHLSSYSKNIDKIFDKHRVYFVEGCLMQSLATPLLFPSGSPLYEPINTMLIRLIQNGLVQKFGSISDDQNPKETVYQNGEISQHTDRMNLSQFRGVFIILLFGYGISFVAFVCELIVANMSKSQRKVNVIIGPKLYYRDD